MNPPTRAPSLMRGRPVLIHDRALRAFRRVSSAAMVSPVAERSPFRAGFAALLVLLVAPPALADSVFVDADSTFVAYEIRSPGTTAFLSRRRFVQRVGTRYSTVLVSPDRAGASPIRLTSSIRLRLDQDFGDDCLIADELCYRATTSRTRPYSNHWRSKRASTLLRLGWK